MAISRSKKEDQVASLLDEFSKSKMTVLTAYKGLTVKQIQELRKQLKAQGGNYKVIKNALIVRAVKEHFDGTDVSHLKGPVALAFGYNDEVQPAKTVVDFAKTSEGLQPLGAINSQGELLNAEDVKRLANLPSREQLTAQLVGTIAAPLSGFVSVLQGNLRGLVTALSAVAEQKEA